MAQWVGRQKVSKQKVAGSNLAFIGYTFLQFIPETMQNFFLIIKPFESSEGIENHRDPMFQ